MKSFHCENLAIEWDFASVEGHQNVVDDHGDVVGWEEKHEKNLQGKQQLSA